MSRRYSYKDTWLRRGSYVRPYIVFRFEQFTVKTCPCYKRGYR